MSSRHSLLLAVGSAVGVPGAYGLAKREGPLPPSTLETALGCLSVVSFFSSPPHEFAHADEETANAERAIADRAIRERMINRLLPRR